MRHDPATRDDLDEICAPGAAGAAPARCPVPKTAPTRRASRPARGRIPRAARGAGPATRAWRKGVAGVTKRPPPIDADPTGSRAPGWTRPTGTPRRAARCTAGPADKARARARGGNAAAARGRRAGGTRAGGAAEVQEHALDPAQEILLCCSVKLLCAAAGGMRVAPRDKTMNEKSFFSRACALSIPSGSPCTGPISSPFPLSHKEAHNPRRAGPAALTANSSLLVIFSCCSKYQVELSSSTTSTARIGLCGLSRVDKYPRVRKNP